MVNILMKLKKEIDNKNRCRLQSYLGENWYAFLLEMVGKVQAIRELAKILNISLNRIVLAKNVLMGMEQ